MKDWRAKAKELNIKMYQRKKVDVIADIETALSQQDETIKVIVHPRKAMEICDAALREYVIEQGLDGDKEITRERWFVNCKRKGIVFKGKAKE